MKTLVGVLLAISGCSDTTSTSPPPDPTPVTIAPAQADVLTCSSVQFTTTDTAAGGRWSVDRGTIGATGLYASPLVVPATPEATVGYLAASGATASATAHLATAFPAAPVTIDTGYTLETAPAEHAITVNGSRAYAVFPAGGGGGVRVLRSTDGGATFAAAPTLATADLTCATSAVDAGNPDVLYVVAHETAQSDTSLRLYVSDDGGQTFAHDYVIADSILDGLTLAICPDIVSPSADHVVIATAAQNNDQTASWTAIYVSADRGASFGSGAGTNSDDYYSDSDVNRGDVFTTGTVLSDGGQNGPRVFSDGKGRACTTYAVDSATGCEGTDCIAVYVQCSTTGGATWTAPAFLASTGTATFPTGAISPSGKVAVAWTQRVSGVVTIEVAISMDAGATFAPAVAYPFDAATYGYTQGPIVQWQGDVLWLAQTTAAADDPRIVIDKTCDFGASWSGALAITQGSDYVGEALIATPTGIAAIGRGLRDSANFPLSLIALTR